jgi:uracil-DNA glycosylase
MAELAVFLERERSDGHAVFPPRPEIFRALQVTALNDVRVIIVGQDPYHGEGQANGLAFSVPDGVRVPPSLRNIFKEISSDTEVQVIPSGDLERWSTQGVLLLNTCLTVRAGEAGSHAGKGWERFTDSVIAVLNDRKEPAVFLLWGRHAREKGKNIDMDRHHVLEAAHPSPLSARNGFFGCRHFSRTNALLRQAGHDPIDWS